MARIPRLDQRIKFQSESRTDDGGGGGTASWANIATAPEVWAAVEPQTGREAVQAMMLQNPTMYRIVIRNRTDVTPQMRIVWTSRADKVLNIRAMPDPGPRAHFRELICEEGVAG